MKKILKLFIAFIAAVSISISLAGCLSSENRGGTPSIPEGSSFQVRFIDVGQADSALIMCDGKTVTFETNKQASDQEKNPTVNNGSGQSSQDRAGKYIGNTNTQKFHSPNCCSLPSGSSRVYFDSYEEAIDAGCEPHESCM